MFGTMSSVGAGKGGATSSARPFTESKPSRTLLPKLRGVSEVTPLRPSAGRLDAHLSQL